MTYGFDSYNQARHEEMMPSLRSSEGGDTLPKILIVLNDQGGGVIYCEREEISPTLRTHTKHHEPIVVLQEDGTEDAGRKEIF